MGLMPQELKAFLDSTGQLWQQGALVGKPVTCFFAGGIGGGQESLVLATIPVFAHHGMLFVPIGYTSPLLFDSSAPHGGSPWGAGTLIPMFGTEKHEVTELEMKVAEHQGKIFAEYSSTLQKGRARLNLSHTVHLSKHPVYPARAEVKAVPWSIPDESYAPVEFTFQAVLDNDSSKKEGGWADPADISLIPREELAKRVSHSGPIVFDSKGYPRNPAGRTGITGRGKLRYWGPNQAADPIITRYKPGTNNEVQVVAILRRDTQIWALPGGKVDPGEGVRETLRREFTEEAGEVAPEQRETFEKQLNELFGQDGVEVYSGYVDDPRNTDQAWMETVAVNFHCNKDLGEKLLLSAGSDAASVMWLDATESAPEFANLYASHKMMVQTAVALLRHKVLLQEEERAAKTLQGAFRKHKQSSFKGMHASEASSKVAKSNEHSNRHSFTVGNDSFRTGVKKLAGMHFSNLKEYTAFMNNA